MIVQVWVKEQLAFSLSWDYWAQPTTELANFSSSQNSNWMIRAPLYSNVLNYIIITLVPVFSDDQGGGWVHGLSSMSD